MQLDVWLDVASSNMYVLLGAMKPATVFDKSDVMMEPKELKPSRMEAYC